MGALKSGAFPVELNGKEYGLLFSLNALDEVQEKFGGYDKLVLTTWSIIDPVTNSVTYP